MRYAEFPGGEWPTMITPYAADGSVDYRALGEMVEWYIKNGVSGLFSVCQSSEMFFLTMKERAGIAKFVVEKTAGRVPVIASGHISDSLGEQIKELNVMAGTGVDAVILITNRLAAQNESDDVWLKNLETLLAALPAELPLGFYECPYPYKRLLTPELARHCGQTGRFRFLKDTSCSLSNIKAKLAAIKGTPLKLYNANTATLLASLRAGATGYSGVMANMQPSLYAWLLAHVDDPRADYLSDMLIVSAFIERQLYPVNAKYFMSLEGLPIASLGCRSKDPSGFSDTFKGEVQSLRRLTHKLRAEFGV